MLLFSLSGKPMGPPAGGDLGPRSAVRVGRDHQHTPPWALGGSPAQACAAHPQHRGGVVDPAPRPGCRAALRGCREVLILLVRHSRMALWVLCSLFLQALISLLALCLLSPSVPSTSRFSNTSVHFSASHISLELFLCLAQWVPVVTT